MTGDRDSSILFDDYDPNSLETRIVETIVETLEQYEYLLLDLFQELQKEGMALTLEQYGLLKKAVEKGYGWRSWEELKRLCKLLWVKPHPGCDLAVFEKAFNRYYHQNRVQTILTKELKSEQETTPIPLPNPFQEQEVQNLLEIPPRILPSGSSQQAIAVKPSLLQPNSRSSDLPAFVLTPTDFPLKLEDVRRIWHLLRKSVPVDRDLELDLEATIERIEREGFFADVEMRPRMTRKAELLLLIDDSSGMIPFFQAFEPFIQAINFRQITPARIYRFTTYPDEYLYEWESPTHAQFLNNILLTLKRDRTITIILSDAGARSIAYNQERIEGTFQFLIKLSPFIRQLIWLNPLPIKQWHETSAWEIHERLNGEMLTYELVSLINKAKKIDRGN